MKRTPSWRLRSSTKNGAGLTNSSHKKVLAAKEAHFPYNRRKLGDTPANFCRHLFTTEIFMAKQSSDTFIPVNIAVLTVSDTRTEASDTSGQTLVSRLQEAGHQLTEKMIVTDDVYQIRAVLSRWIADPQTDVVLINGGTGITFRDVTPEAVKPLLDKEIEGFGELFRTVSLKDVETSTIQSRALGGIANGTFIFCLPGSTGACRTAWDAILRFQLDSLNRPCNFVELLPRVRPR